MHEASPGMSRKVAWLGEGLVSDTADVCACLSTIISRPHCPATPSDSESCCR